MQATGTVGVTVFGSSSGDQIYGNSGADTLNGNGGNDLLVGGGGIDTSRGGMGNDVYALGADNDIVVELLNQGVDTITSTVSRNLSTYANVENLILQGTAVSGTGNSLNNIIYGTNTTNALSGGR